mgnify:CR=1 FL=1
MASRYREDYLARHYVRQDTKVVIEPKEYGHRA